MDSWGEGIKPNGRITTETLFNKSVHVFDGWPLIEYQIYNIKYFVKYDETDITI